VVVDRDTVEQCVVLKGYGQLVTVLLVER
jgi:hypothetical protein